MNQTENLSRKQEVSRGTDTEVLRYIQEAVVPKKTILLDAWYIKPKRLNIHFPEAQVLRVFLYCPLKITYERFLERNSESLRKENLSEKRHLRQLIGSLMSLYQINHHPAEPIQEITH